MTEEKTRINPKTQDRVLGSYASYRDRFFLMQFYSIF